MGNVIGEVNKFSIDIIKIRRALGAGRLIVKGFINILRLALNSLGYLQNDGTLVIIILI